MEEYKEKGYEPLYWNDKGKYMKEYESLKMLIPMVGQAVTMDGELLRCVTNIYYRRMNDGNEADLHSYEFKFIRLVGGNGIIGIGMRLVDYDLMMDRVIELIIKRKKEVIKNKIVGE